MTETVNRSSRRTSMHVSLSPIFSASTADKIPPALSTSLDADDLGQSYSGLQLKLGPYMSIRSIQFRIVSSIYLQNLKVVQLLEPEL